LYRTFIVSTPCSSPTIDEGKGNDTPTGGIAAYHSQAGVLTGGDNGFGLAAGVYEPSQRTKEKCGHKDFDSRTKILLDLSSPQRGKQQSETGANF